MGKNYKYKFTTKEGVKFNDFLNKTIIGTSYNFFNEWKKDSEYLVEIKEDIVDESSVEVSLLKETDDEYLSIAMKSLTDDERSVISFSFEEKLSGKEIAKEISILKNSVYRKRKKTINKLRKLIMEAKNDERNRYL